MHVANEAPASFRSSAVRPGPLELLRTAVREVVSRRRLIRYLVGADIKKKGSDTVLGNVWWMLDPLLAMSVYVIVMTVIFQRSTPDFPLYLLSALLPFKWFTQTVSDSVGSVVRSEKLIKQIQFPKIVLPLTGTLAELVSFFFGMLVLALLLVLFYPAHLSLTILWVPVLVAIQFVLGAGLALVMAAVTVFYRDVGIVVGHVMRLLFFLSPILWSFDNLASRSGQIREAVGDVGYSVLHYNPIAILLTAYRHVIYGTVSADGETWLPPTSPDVGLLVAVLASALVLLVLGTWFFKRLEPAFAKVL